jgi:hypothetical protein
MIAADELISYFVDISKQGVLRSALVHLFRLASVLVIYFTEHGSSSDAQIQVTPLTGLGITVIMSSLPEMYEGEIA